MHDALQLGLRINQWINNQIKCNGVHVISRTNSNVDMIPQKKLKRWHAAYRLIVLFVSTMYKFLWPEGVEHRSEKETEEGGTKFNAIFIVGSLQFCVVLDAPSVQQSSTKSVGDRRAVVGAD